MILVKNGKRIGQIGDIFEVNIDIAQMSWLYNIFKDMKPSSKFYIQLHDIRKSSKIYYIFKYLKLKQDFIVDDHYSNNHNVKYLRFTRDQLIVLIDMGSFVNKLDTVDLATLLLYSEIK